MGMLIYTDKLSIQQSNLTSFAMLPAALRAFQYVCSSVLSCVRASAAAGGCSSYCTTKMTGKEFVQQVLSKICELPCFISSLTGVTTVSPPLPRATPTAHKCMRERTRTCIHTYIHTHTHAPTNKRTATYPHAHTHNHLPTPPPTHPPSLSLSLSRTHTHTHTQPIIHTQYTNCIQAHCDIHSLLCECC